MVSICWFTLALRILAMTISMYCRSIPNIQLKYMSYLWALKMSSRQFLVTYMQFCRVTEYCTWSHLWFQVYRECPLLVSRWQRLGNSYSLHDCMHSFVAFIHAETEKSSFSKDLVRWTWNILRWPDRNLVFPCCPLTMQLTRYIDMWYMWLLYWYEYFLCIICIYES